MKEIILNLHYPSPGDHTSFYRALGPLSVISGLNVQPRGEVQYPELQADLAFVHRPFRSEELEVIKMYKKYGVPVWIDYDDDFFNVTADSSAYFMFSHPKTRQNVVESLAAADAVTVTTQVLADLYQVHTKKTIRVIPNAMPDWLAKRKQNPSGKKKVLWRGNTSHVRDMDLVKKEILEVADVRRDWSWVFMGGYIPYDLKERMIKAGIGFEVVSNLPLLNYFDELLEQAPSVVIVPLDETVFNRAKSNIAWIEATWAGASTVAPSWPEWNKPGVIHYDDRRSFKETLIHATVREWDTSASWNHITENLMLSKVNEARINVMQQLTQRNLICQ